MANNFVTGLSSETGDMDTAGSSTGITVQGGVLVDVACSITSGDSLTLDGEYLTGNTGDDVSNSKEWLVIETYTTDVAKVLRVASRRRLRITMSVDGGGAASHFELTAGNRE
jgi:hypothetical protein